MFLPSHDQLETHRSYKQTQREGEAAQEKTAFIAYVSSLAATVVPSEGRGCTEPSDDKKIVQWLYACRSNRIPLPQETDDETPPMVIGVDAQRLTTTKERRIGKEKILTSVILNTEIRTAIMRKSVTAPTIDERTVLAATRFPPTVKLENDNGQLEEIYPNTPQWEKAVEVITWLADRSDKLIVEY